RPRTDDEVVLNQDDLIKLLASKITRLEGLQERSTALNDQIELLKSNIKKQEEINKDLEKAVSRGEYNKETTRIFELKDNIPAEDLAKLEDATQKLSGVDINSDLDVIQSFKEEIAKKEQMVSLVEEEMDKKFKLLTKIFGYNIEFLENNCVKLTSIYSDPEDHKSLTFEIDQDGTIQIKEGHFEFMQSIEEANGSVPCLLGNVTVKLVEEKNASKSNEDESLLDRTYSDMSINGQS
ncbi:41420_t:CDS:2, partial [Gigaspora margarita]